VIEERLCQDLPSRRRPRAQLGDDVEVVPFCVIGRRFELARQSLLSHVGDYREQNDREGNPFSSQLRDGGIPQDLKYHGEEARLEIAIAM